MMEWRPLIWAQVAHLAGVELPEGLDAERRAWLEGQREAAGPPATPKEIS